MTTASQHTLHLIFSMDAWLKAKPLIELGDQILFLQDSVYQLQNALNISNKLFARELDIIARNIKPSSNITIIDDNQWVELTNSAHNVISW